MPKLSRALPKYRKHRASGQAVVTLCGVDHYLGPHGTKASKLEYDRLVAEWLQNGRQLRVTDDSAYTVVELMAAYLRFARGYYRKNGKETSEVAGVIHAMRPLRSLYGRTNVSDFGPLALQTVRHKMVESGLSRSVINQNIGRIRRMFRWAAGEEMIPASIAQALKMVSGLRQGRTDARETVPVAPVDDEIVDATLPYLPSVVADMVRAQRHTGARPAEVCLLRPCEIDRSSEVWQFRPSEDKTQHRGRERTILIGPKAQAILLRYLARDSTEYCFQPVDSEEKRRAAQHQLRTTPLSCGNRPHSNRVLRPKRRPGRRYTTASYRRAITRACDKAFPHPTLGEIARRELTPEQLTELKAWQSEHRWAPNQLRHAAATEVRRQFGLEAAQVILGHSQANVTQVYAERDMARGIEVARAIG
jgi:integrase